MQEIKAKRQWDLFLLGGREVARRGVAWAAWRGQIKPSRGGSGGGNAPGAMRGVGGGSNKGRGGFPRRQLAGEEENRGGELAVLRGRGSRAPARGVWGQGEAKGGGWHSRGGTGPNHDGEPAAAAACQALGELEVEDEQGNHFANCEKFRGLTVN